MATLLKFLCWGPEDIIATFDSCGSDMGPTEAWLHLHNFRVINKTHHVTNDMMSFVKVRGEGNGPFLRGCIHVYTA